MTTLTYHYDLLTEAPEQVIAELKDLYSFGTTAHVVPGGDTAANAPGALTLDQTERTVAERALSVSRSMTTTGQLQAVLDAVNAIRAGNPIGTLRRSGASTHYAFRYSPGKWLLINTNNAAPAYKTTTDEQDPSIATSWDLLYDPNAA